MLNDWHTSRDKFDDEYKQFQNYTRKILSKENEKPVTKSKVKYKQN